MIYKLFFKSNYLKNKSIKKILIVKKSIFEFFSFDENFRVKVGDKVSINWKDGKC